MTAMEKQQKKKREKSPRARRMGGYTNGEREQGECHLQARAVKEKSGYCANQKDAGSTVPRRCVRRRKGLVNGVCDGSIRGWRWRARQTERGRERETKGGGKGRVEDRQGERGRPEDYLRQGETDDAAIDLQCKSWESRSDGIKSSGEKRSTEETKPKPKPTEEPNVVIPARSRASGAKGRIHSHSGVYKMYISVRLQILKILETGQLLPVCEGAWGGFDPGNNNELGWAINHGSPGLSMWFEID
ncbi:hypothetical protein P170DRAFT_84142 [Aspergillus steynii IBT 23096]|uniref:Uncharacterized protein n=1 Tax=Aspergillus steynii IBT 23096 TaxID=1392250 RepID=A0A2I2GFR6_9EURO|nr:uncharacterized protein P170DRAFT_84142 [Aspergillus steynii IBT 23096]PLB51723.1 hypothetical protein P170DRAFT_84142 [Aspergillus steynii IBT 23096]